MRIGCSDGRFGTAGIAATAELPESRAVMKCDAGGSRREEADPQQKAPNVDVLNDDDDDEQ